VRRIFIASAACLLSGLLLWGAIAVGAGAATSAIQASFINAYNRGTFSLKVTTPLTNVQPLGSPGLVQEFTAAANSSLKCALIKPDPNAPVSQFDTLQVLSDIYTYYTSVGESTAGYPTIDTTACPTNNFGTCDYQTFTKDYALFVYSAPTTANISVADPFYTVWNNAGGVSGPYGVATAAQASVTSAFTKVAGAEQVFSSGAIFSYPASSTTPTIYGIVEPVNTAYNSAGGFAALGFPTSAAIQINTSGLMQQTFENGRIQWTAGSTPAVLYPVANVYITYASQGLNLANPGASATLTASTLDTNGSSVTNRTLTWSTTNGSVVSVAGNGYSAVVTAVGAGTASIYVTSEGKTSAPLTVTVGAVCCSIGQGAPTAAISTAFQAAVSRNQLSVALPAAAPVVRTGTGYAQALTSSSGAVYVVAEADGATSAFILTGAVYTAYLADGGFTGPLGYPVTDPLPGPAQKFAGGAYLAGSPALIVAAPVAGKWFGLGGVLTGAGAPVAPPGSFASYSGVAGTSEAFANGVIYGITSGSLSGQAFYSTGPILARYLALSGPASALGIPISDVYANGAVMVENFEGGYIDLQPGASAAVEHYNPRTPALTVAPSIVVPGGRVHVSATGFALNSTMAFTITGQPAFSVKPASGSFEWDIVIPASAKQATVTIQATTPGSTATASASYTITPAAALLPTLTIVSGDRQTGLPGSTLAAPIVALLADSSGSPIAGVPVTVSASPGGAAQTSAVTDQNGRASILFRLPPAAGVAVGSVSAAGQAVTFSALAAAGSLANFPAFAETAPQTPLATAFSALLRYYQNAGSLPSANGLANPASLTQYLTGANGFVSSDSGDPIANPWIAAAFAGAAPAIYSPTLNQICDLLNLGTPVLLNLNLTINGGAAGGATVDAIGVNADGSIAIVDPNPALGRTSLADYLNGFTAQGNSVKATMASLFTVAPAQAAAGGAPFTVASVASAAAATNSPLGACPGATILGPSGGGVAFQYCDGAQALYETDFATNKGATIADLTGGPATSIPAGSATSWSIARKNNQLIAAALTPSITAVTDSAAFAPSVSPGGLFTIFGIGFSGSPSVTVGGKAAQVIAAFPFQINAAMPTAAAIGSANLLVTGSAGSTTSSISVSATSPGIFMAGTQAAILNSDGTLNGPSSPATRGQFVSIYCSGLGATTLKAGLQNANVTPSVVINGTSVSPTFAGLVTGFVGLYQVNVTIPGSLAPSLTGTILLQQGTQVSNTVPIAVD
jgi:uncharacterized protein (TIGR03437 family)